MCQGPAFMIWEYLPLDETVFEFIHGYGNRTFSYGSPHGCEYGVHLYGTGDVLISPAPIPNEVQ